jgi:electron transfer flavoprotein-quinone oxidoreductase
MSLYKEGTNHAMESGRYAGQTAVEAKKSGDFSRATAWPSYEERLKAGTVMRDLKKYSDVPDVLNGSPALFSLYPDKVTRLLVDYFTVSEEPKSETQKKAVRKFLRDLPKLQFLRDIFRARKMI